MPIQLIRHKRTNKEATPLYFTKFFQKKTKYKISKEPIDPSLFPFDKMIELDAKKAIVIAIDATGIEAFTLTQAVRNKGLCFKVIEQGKNEISGYRIIYTGFKEGFNGYGYDNLKEGYVRGKRDNRKAVKIGTE